MEHPFICEKAKDSMSIMPIKEVVLPLTFSDGTGDQCPPGYSTFGGKHLESVESIFYLIHRTHSFSLFSFNNK